MSYPTKESREKCWNARDKYFECLDSSGELQCKSLRKVYEANCPQTWVKHFDRQREYLKFKENLEKEERKQLKS